MYYRRLVSALLLLSVTVVSLGAQILPHGVYLTFDEAQPVISEMSVDAPRSLADLSGPSASKAWQQWITKQDTDIRSRLGQGDEDSLINLLLFGTSFTKQPRILFAQL